MNKKGDRTGNKPADASSEQRNAAPQAPNNSNDHE